MEYLNREYTLLFNGITEAILSLEATVSSLKALQAAAEEAYLASPQQTSTDELQAGITGLQTVLKVK